MFAIKTVILSIILAGAFGSQFNIKADGDDPTDATTASTAPSIPSGDRRFSIESSNAPDPQYEWDAVQCLAEAYILRPTSVDTVMAAFSELYTLKHSGAWNVHAGCRALYIPKTGRYILIELRVTDSYGDTIVTIYN